MPTQDKETKVCSLPEVNERDLSHISDGNRLRLISFITKMWVNGTDLSYYFFKSPVSWKGSSAQEQAVRDAFGTWKDLGIGLTFSEVENASDAIIRIAFNQGDGSWSYVGRDALKFANTPDQRTINYGWDLTTPYGRDTALHEIGHAIGFPHEHQNPKAGIVWNEEAVYKSLGGPPNNWTREKTRWNIIRKIPPTDVDGSQWDKDSIMHYQFAAGLIQEPSEYQTKALVPKPGLSELDIKTVREIYPSQEPVSKELPVFESRRFKIKAGEQVDYFIKVKESRKYTLATFGELDTIMVLFELREGKEELIDGDDDSGQDTNAKIIARLHPGREYIVRTRLYYAKSKGSGSIMLY